MASAFENRFRHGLAAALILACGSFAYWNSLDAPFVFDDVPNIERNEKIRIESLRPSQLWAAAFEGPIPGRPLAFLTFALNYYAGGNNPRSFHLTNLAIHLLTGLVVYWLALAILDRSNAIADGFTARMDVVARWYGALMAALIFTLHPIQTQSVTYIVQRMNSLAAFLYLVAFALYLAGRSRSRGPGRWALWSVGVLIWLLSLSSKQITVTLPVVVLLYEWYFYQGLSTAWFRKRAAWAITAAVVLAIVSIGQLWLVGEVFSHYEVRDFTMDQRLLTQARVVCLYASLTLLPFPGRFNLLHEVETSRTIAAPITTLFSLIAVLIYLYYAVRTARRSRFVSFCLLWPVIHLVIESSVLPLEMMYEHRMYLPMFGVALLAGSLLAYFLPRNAHAPRLLIVATLAFLLLTGTRARNEIWRDSIVFWTDVIAKSPTEERAYLNRGSEHVARQEWSLAIQDFNQALSLRPDDQAYFCRGMALLNSGRLEQAIDDFTYSYNSGLTPEIRVLSLRNRGTVYSAQGETEKAIADFSTAIDILPGDVDSRFNRANSYRRIGEYRRAIADYSICVGLSPTYAQAHNNLAALLADSPEPSLRDPQRAITHARRACELSDWSNWQFIDTLALAYASAGDFGDAARWQLRAIEVAPLDERNPMRHRLDQYRSKETSG